MRRLENRTVIITGAAGGLGRAAAFRFAHEGAKLCLADCAPTEDVLMSVRAAGAEAIAAAVDVTDEASVQRMVDLTVAEFGTVDVLINIAGISSHGASDDIDSATWERVLRTNLTSVFLCCKAVLPLMRKNGYGRIVSTSSVLGKNGGNPRPWLDPEEQKKAGSIAYGASKAGIHAVTSYLAKENARFGITVNCVAPGPIRTHMTRNFPQALHAQIPLGRMGEPEDVADAMAFLAGDQASFITGEVVDVNGGAWCD